MTSYDHERVIEHQRPFANSSGRTRAILRQVVVDPSQEVVTGPPEKEVVLPELTAEAKDRHHKVLLGLQSIKSFNIRHASRR